MLGLERMAAWFADDNATFEFWQTLFAHHGRPWRSDPTDADAHWKPDGAGSDPIADLVQMRTALDQWFALAFATGPTLPDAPAFHHAFAGLLMLADWLSSDTQFFPFAHGAAADRMTFARPRAHVALQSVGLAVETRRSEVLARRTGFSDLFGVANPRPVQRDAIVPTSRCVVLEAETGSGKTEAALWRFRHLFEAGEVDGLYFALPTRVAATQMFARVKRFRDVLFPESDRPTVVLAVPGQVGADDAKGHPLPEFAFEWNDRPDETRRQGRWAAEHPKRFLAAQIAVGTVDQALLSAIAVRHAHLRGTALLRQLLMVDEVHASDRYMETLLGNLLRGHLQAGGHALLLSATLGSAMQARLLGTPVASLALAQEAPYPALSWADDGQVRVHRVEPSGQVKQVHLKAVEKIDDPAAVARLALEAAECGAKVLVIRNTVRAAIETAVALEAITGEAHPALFRVGDVATLHHGRFSPGDRQLLDTAVEARLGNGAAAVPVVVARSRSVRAGACPPSPTVIRKPPKSTALRVQAHHLNPGTDIRSYRRTATATGSASGAKRLRFPVFYRLPAAASRAAWDSLVSMTAFKRATMSSTKESGAREWKATLRAIQSKLLRCASNTAPFTRHEAGTGTSNALPETLLVMGQAKTNPSATLKDCGDSTRAGRRPACSVPACGEQSTTIKSPRSGWYATIGHHSSFPRGSPQSTSFSCAETVASMSASR